MLLEMASKKVGYFPTECPFINDIIAAVLYLVAG